MLHVPTEMLGLPLVRPDLPATPYRLSNVVCANDVLTDGDRIKARQPSREQLSCLLGRYLLIGRASHYRAEPT